MNRAPVLAAVVGVLAILPTAVAQDAVKEPNWALIRSKALAAIDRNTVQRWLDANIQDLLTNEDAKAVQKNGVAFYRKLMDQYNASGASAPFKEDLAGLLAGSFSKAYRPSADSAKPPHPLGAGILLMVLRDFANQAALPCYQAALADPTPAPRYMAAEGLLAIGRQITNPQWTALIPVLVKAASGETNNTSLDRIYRLLFAAAEDATRLDAVTKALTDILNNRIRGFEQDGRSPLRADGEAVSWLADKAAAANNNASRTAVCRLAGRLLADAVYSYIHDKPTKILQEQLERIMFTVEPKLESLVRAVDRNVKTPEATIRGALQGGGTDLESKLAAAANAWVGEGQTQGVLNKPPFNFPVGLESVRKPATSTATAPAP